MPSPARAGWHPAFAGGILEPGPDSARPRAYVAGRGAGKTRAGACWLQRRVDDQTMKLGCLIAPTAADIRDVMVEGPSGLIAVAPPRSRPRFESSKRRVEWPNGARAICLSGEEPARARAVNLDPLWADDREPSGDWRSEDPPEMLTFERRVPKLQSPAPGRAVDGVKTD